MIFSDSRKSSLLSGITFIVLAVVAVCVTVFGQSKTPETQMAHRGRVLLNERLTNEYCEADTLVGLEKSIDAFLRQWEIHGASLAVMRGDSLLYAHGFGMADEDVPMEPSTLLRVASVSKLITAAGIMRLVEMDSLSLGDHPFAQDGVLCEYAPKIKDRKWYDITIRELLMHEAGFGVGRAGDPLFTTRDHMTRMGLSEPPSTDQIISSQVGKYLAYVPGSGSRYSNFGYLVLSSIIEHVTGEPYESWMQAHVLEPAGCYDFHIARNFYDERYPGESRYHAHAGDNPVLCYLGDSVYVERCYGGNDVSALQGAGGWVCSVAELMRFVASIDGLPGVPDILSPESIAEMTAVTDSTTYGYGWNDCSQDGIWTRSGTLSSTGALIKYYHGEGECWILVTNTGTYRGPHFSKYISTLFNRSRASYSALLPLRDLFNE